MTRLCWMVMTLLRCVFCRGSKEDLQSTDWRSTENMPKSTGVAAGITARHLIAGDRS